MRELLQKITVGAKQIALWFGISDHVQTQSSRLPRMPVLVLCASQEDGEALAAMAGNCGWDLVSTKTFAGVIEALHQRSYAVIVIDRDACRSNWRSVVSLLAGEPCHPCVLLALPIYDDYLWGELVRFGGYDVLVKPLREQTTVEALEGAWLSWKAGSHRTAASTPPIRR